MKNLIGSSVLMICILISSGPSNAQNKIDKGDPPNISNIPSFYKSKLSDIDNEIQGIEKGKVEAIATSPGGLPVYAVYYGEKEDFKSKANYNSAVGAGDINSYACKDSTSRPVVFFIGPVHGQEAEGIVGLVNLMHIAESGMDYRGNDWSELQEKVLQCRTIIIPCGNPDGRLRCPYDGFIGLPTAIMTKYGQGTRRDGSSWGWPGAKSVHPMKGDIGILGAYFNDDGINMMHDDFFSPMADETRAILDIAKSEAPDITVSLHSHEYRSVILEPAYLPLFMKNRVYDLSVDLNNRYENANLEFRPGKWSWSSTAEDADFPPTTSFNLISALHHVSGTMSFTYECCHGSVSERFPEPMVDFEDILDMQLILYDEMLDYILENHTFIN